MTDGLPESLHRIHIMPVRHHSPVSAMAVERGLRAVRPRLVLVEGPSDATDLIPLLFQPDTGPPVAILAYRPAADGAEPRTMVDPFCDYSPELVAMRVGHELGAGIRFFDAPAAAWFDLERPCEDTGQETLPDDSPPNLYRELAERLGFTSHEEMWDSRFEMVDPAVAGELIGRYGDMVRDWTAEHRAGRELDRFREAWMVQEIAAALTEGYRPEEVAVVCGAAHMTGIREGAAAPDLVAKLSKSEPARFALIPYSYPRLSEQSGYGAGNRAPAFYQEIWRRHGDWNAASLDFLVRLVNAMRDWGYTVSLADAIEAYRLAANLAGMRNKPAVGLEEVRDAALACYSRGADIPGFALGQLLIGEEVGSVTATVAKTSLQQDFLDQVKRHGIPFSDRSRDLRLNVTNPGEQAASAFLHRLVVAGIPFASLARVASGRDQAENYSSLERLMALREKWEVRWTPATDIRLVELGIFGNSLVEVCQRLLRRKAERARSLEETASVLLDSVRGRLEGIYDEVLAACEKASSEDDDFPSVARACYLLDVLIGYVDVPGQAELLGRLAERVFVRGCLLLPRAAAVSEAEVGGVCESIKLLHQVGARRRQRGEGEDLLVERLRDTAAGTGDAHPRAAGLASAVLYLDACLSDGELANALDLHLSRGTEPTRAARFVEGLFSLNRSVLVRNQAIVGSLTTYISGLDGEAFVAIVPILRRSLAGLSPSEMGYLVDTIAAVLGISEEGAGEFALESSQLDELAGLDQEIGDLF